MSLMKIILRIKEQDQDHGRMIMRAITRIRMRLDNILYKVEENY